MADARNVSSTAVTDYLKTLGGVQAGYKPITGFGEGDRAYSPNKDQDASDQDFLSWLGDIVSRPLFAITEIGSSVADTFDKQQALNPLDAIGHVASAPFRGFFSNNPEDKIYTGDLIEKVADIGGRNADPNYKDVENNVNPVVKGVAGFVGDVALDPTTYIGYGLYKKLGEKIAGGASKAVNAVKETRAGKVVADTAQSLAEVPAIAKTIQTTKKAAETFGSVVNKADEPVDVAAQSKVLADGQVAQAASEIAQEATTKLPSEVTKFLDKSLNDAIKATRVKGGKASVLKQLENFQGMSGTTADAVASGGIRTEKIDKFDDYLSEVIKLSKAAEAPLTTKLVRNGEAVFVDATAEATKAAKFLKSPKGALFKKMSDEVIAVETRMAKYQAKVDELLNDKDLLNSTSKQEELKAAEAAVEEGKSRIIRTRQKIQEAQDAIPELSTMAELYAKFTDSFDAKGATAVSLFGDAIGLGTDGVLDAFHYFRLERAYQRDYIEALFGAKVADQLRKLNGPKFDETLDSIAQLLRSGGVDAGSFIAQGKVMGSIAKAQADFLKHIGVDYPSFQKAIQIAENRIANSTITTASTTEDTVKAYTVVKNLPQFSAKYELKDSDEANFVLRGLNEILPPVVAKNFDRKSIVKTHKVQHGKDANVRRTSTEYGEGVGVDIQHANTGTQQDLYVEATTYVNSEIINKLGLKGWTAIKTRARLTRAMMRAAEDYFASNGIYLHIDMNKKRYALTMSNILDTIAPVEKRAAGEAKEIQDTVTYSLYNVEGKPKFDGGVQTEQVGSSVKPSIFLDAVFTAIETGDIEAVKKALMTTKRRQGGDVENWLSNPEAVGRVGFIPAIKDKATGKYVTQESTIAGTFNIKGSKGDYIGIKASTIIDNVAQLLVDNRENLLALANANSEMIATTRGANTLAITAASTKTILAHAADPALRAQSLWELADLDKVVEEVAVKVGADSVSTEVAKATVKEAIDPSAQKVAKAQVTKADAQVKKVSAKTASEKAKAQKQVEGAQASRAEAGDETVAQNLDEVTADIANAPEDVKQVTDMIDSAGTMQSLTDTVYANIKGYMMKSPFISRIIEKFSGSYGLTSDTLKFDLFRMSRVSQALTRIVRGDRTKFYRQLGVDYGKPMADGKTTFLARAFHNIQNGNTTDPDPLVQEAMDKLDPVLKELFDFQNTSDSAVLGNAFFQEGPGVEYLNRLLKQYDILKPTGKEASKEVQKFIKEGRDYFDLERAMAKRAEQRKITGKDIGLLSAAMDQWREWPIDDVVDFLAKADVVVLHAAADMGVVESVKRIGMKAGWASDNATEGFVQVDRGGRIGQLFPADMHFDPEAAQMLNRLDELSQKTTEINNFFNNVYDPIQQAWQFGITQLRPGHHIRNLIGDETITYFADGTKYNLRSAKDAFKMQAVYGQYQNADFIRMLNQMGEVVVPKAGDILSTGKYGELSVQTLTEAIARMGLPTAKIVDDIFDVEKAAGAVSKVAKKLVFQDTPIGEFAGGLSESRDHWARMKHFMQIIHKEQNAAVKKFKTVDELYEYAAKRVQKFHPDSTTLSKFEQKYMRRLVPFYGWMRGAIPALAEATFTHPGRVATLNKASYNIAVMTGVNPDSLYDPFPEDQMFPSFLTDKVQGPQVEINGKYYSVSPGIVSWDLANTFLSDPFHGAISATSPLLRIPLELMTGTSLGTGAKIRDASDYIDSNLPGVNYLASVSGYSPTGSILSMMQGMGPDPMLQVAAGNRTGTSSFLSAVNWLTGAGIAEYSKPNYINYAEIEKRDREAVKTRSDY